MKRLIAISIATLVLSSCASISVPLGQGAKYGTITVGYLPPDNLPEWVQSPTLKDK